MKIMQETRPPASTISRDTVVEKINPHLLSLLRVEREHQQLTLQPGCLLTSARFDVMAKYLYAKQRQYGGAGAWATHIYREHLKAFCDFKEGDGSGKTSFDDYVANFIRLLDGFAANGFDADNSLLPVGRDNVMIDGAHRLAAALYYGSTVECVCFDVTPDRYDYRYFRQRGMDPDVCDAMALEYCRLSHRVKVAVVFPVAGLKLEHIIDLLGGQDCIVYAKDVVVSRLGRANLIRLLYAGEHWVADGRSETRGLRDHVENRFREESPVRFLFFECVDADQARAAKEKIRKLTDAGNYGIHVNDSHRETLRIAETVLNRNSIHWLNHRQIARTRVFDRLFATFRGRLLSEAGLREVVCVDSSSVLAVYGLRDVNDLDYLCLPSVNLEFHGDEIRCHNEENHYYNDSIEDIISDPRLHFYYEGIKFASLDVARRMKETRREQKDRLDIDRIDALLHGSRVPYSPAYVLTHMRERTLSYRFRLVRWMRAHLPAWLIPFARYVYQLPSRVAETFGPDKKQMIYRGFVLHYSRGTSLIHGIKRGQLYEPLVTKRIVDALQSSDNKIFVDIGANIGLMSLNVTHEIPASRIFAFEPGLHQVKLLSQTVYDNGLDGQITVINSALGKESGQAEFFVHHSRHASGDGFRNTGRAGKANPTRVGVVTLDQWWLSAGKPAVDVVKIDTEGAELWVLQGAQDFLSACKPILVMEIERRNLQAYPYGADSIVSFLTDKGYKVMTIHGVPVSAETIGHYQWTCADYVAVPRHDC